MRTPFDPVHGLIIIPVRLFGPTGDLVARLALDTGASATVVRNALLITTGYAPDAMPKSVKFTTGSGVETAPRLTIDRVEALGRQRVGFPVAAHTLPPSASVDGVLGLDFLRKQVLTVDFVNGEISLA